MPEPASLDQVIDRIRFMPDAAPRDFGAAPVDHGRFEGLPAQVEFALDKPRTGKLLRALTYVLAGGRQWPVPPGAWLDGASIPQAFWSVIGGPFEGKYLEPSIIHDHYCITRSRSWRDTHRMFHEAMLCRGVNGFKARFMFYAVYRFGPKWPDPAAGAGFAPPPAPSVSEAPSDADAQSILEDATALSGKALEPAAIEALADSHAVPARGSQL